MILEQALTIRQIYRISTMYWDDKYGTQSVSNEASFGFVFGFSLFFSPFVLILAPWYKVSCDIDSQKSLCFSAGGCSDEGDLEQG